VEALSARAASAQAAADPSVLRLWAARAPAEAAPARGGLRLLPIPSVVDLATEPAPHAPSAPRAAPPPEGQERVSGGAAAALAAAMLSVPRRGEEVEL
jgi:hypothetical protein